MKCTFDRNGKSQNQVGFKGTLLEFFEYVRNKPELKPFTKPEEVIANFERIYTVKPNVDKLFFATQD
jgi:hypothetical protein